MLDWHHHQLTNKNPLLLVYIKLDKIPFWGKITIIIKLFYFPCKKPQNSNIKTIFIRINIHFILKQCLILLFLTIGYYYIWLI